MSAWRLRYTARRWRTMWRPLAAQVLGLDAVEAGAGQALPVPRDALDRHRGHPLVEAPALAVVQARGGDPVAEGHAPARRQHARALGERAALVRHVQETLLAHHGVERAGRAGERLGVAAHHADDRVEPHETREAKVARRASGVQVQRGNARAEAVGEEPRRPTEAGAHVEDAMARHDSGPARQGLHRGQPAVVVLVPVVQVVRARRPAVHPAPGEGGAHPALADRMTVVEVEDGGDVRAHRRRR